MVSEELLIICSAEELEKLEDVVPVSELDSIILEEDDSFPVAIEELLAGISGSCCSGISALDDESEETCREYGSYRRARENYAEFSFRELHVLII